MTKIVLSKLSPKELRESLAMSRNVVADTKRQITAETRVLSFKDMAIKNREKLGKQVNALLKAFERYANKVVQVGSKGVPMVKLITPEVTAGLVKPFKDFIALNFKAETIEQAVEGINAQRQKDIDNYGGRREGIIEEINAYYDSKINLYLKPLQVLEAQLNSFAPTKSEMASLPQLGGRITKFLTTDVVDVAVVETKPAPTNKGGRPKKLDKVAN